MSLDQIGGFFGGSVDVPFDEKRHLAFLEALKGCLSPDLIERINNARISLGKYIEDEEAEDIVERIDYWDYAASDE